MNRIIFIFLDGFGMGEDNDTNPFTMASMPFFGTIFGGPLVHSSAVSTSKVLLKGIDANLDVEGIPQSATGQTALFTGQNASKHLGYHLPAFPGKKLTAIINSGNILQSCARAGLRTTFANSYSERYFKLVAARKLFHSATTLCVYSANLPFRSLDDLVRDRAVHWDMTRSSLTEYCGDRVPVISAARAGRDLALISREYEMVLYECFLPDVLGHKRELEPKLKLLSRIDAFVENVFSAADENVSIVISSDHGNIENLAAGSHTRNPVPLIVLGKAAKHFAEARSIMDIRGLIESWLGIDS